MSLLTRAGDFIYTFRFLRLLTTPWTKTGAYKAGIIDENGKVIKKASTPQEKAVYNLFHRLVFNIKRLINKVPLGKTTIASYIAALFLIKEKFNLSDDDIAKVLHEACGYSPDKNVILQEDSNRFLDEHGNMCAGTYTLTNDIALPSTGETLAKINSNVIFEKDTAPCGSLFGVHIFEAYHPSTNQKIKLTTDDLRK